MIPEFDRSWLKDVVNVFLLRDPARVIASYHVQMGKPTLDDIGFKQQAEIFEQVADQRGEAPAVIDSADILANPQMELRKLCDHIDLEFHPTMLSWPEGGHKGDGPWAPHWYQSVWNSSGFGKAAEGAAEVPDESLDLLDKAQPYYNMMSTYKL